MTDRELLELAAKAAGIDGQWSEAYSAIHVNTAPLRNFVLWSPLTDDGDALRLAVKLDIDVFIQLVEGCTMASAKPEIDEIEPHGNDPYTATRRAITRAAAAIGANK